MKTLLYHHLDSKKIPNFNKIRAFLEADDFYSAEVKKIGDNLYRARLNATDRLLFSIYEHQNESYALILEHIAQHNYQKSRFLRTGADLDEDKIPIIEHSSVCSKVPLNYLNPQHSTFYVLDKIISFDEIQAQVYHVPLPLLIIGSAGSGKTMLVLEKMKCCVGNVLYVTRSPYLVHNSHSLYYALNYENDDQQISFLSFDDYLASIHISQAKELPLNEFSQWFYRQRGNSSLKDPHPLFEEFKGVLTGQSIESPYLSREEYFKLGVKQSIFSQEERGQAYDLFIKYLAFLQEHHYYDTNILSYDYLQKVVPQYDAVIIDEVQDLTNVQLQLILNSLHQSGNFICCGDSNQIVHPNFFSWSTLKSLFFKQHVPHTPHDITRILNTNYRNSPEVTEVSNRILKLKTARFGSIDKESHYLIQSNSANQGQVFLLANQGNIQKELNQKTRQSTRFAIIVMHADQKAEAKTFFNTPLVFSIQEAKGLEYDNIILYNFISSEEKRFRNITQGIDLESIMGDFNYGRAKDKTDKSLEIYKFYINALYVAITRAVRNIYWLESHPQQDIFNLLGLKPLEGNLDLQVQGSSLEDWRKEANKLEMQGKQEQAEEIRSQILKIKPVTWEILTKEKILLLQQKVLEKNDKKAKLLLFEYALVHHSQYLFNQLIACGFNGANTPEKGLKLLNQKYFLAYESKNPNTIIKQIDQYGVDFRNVFNQTPLMVATHIGNELLLEKILTLEPNSSLVNNFGLNAFQIALEQACLDPKYMTKKLPLIYHKLMPESIVLQIDERLVKLDNHQMPFLIFNLMIALFYQVFSKNAVYHAQAFSTQDFMDMFNKIPDSFIPPYRKKRAYISSILSQNEVESSNKYSRKLFLRLKQGQYVINPKLSIRIANDWYPIYDLLNLDLLAIQHNTYWGDGWDKSYHQKNIQIIKNLIKQRIIT